MGEKDEPVGTHGGRIHDPEARARREAKKIRHEKNRAAKRIENQNRASGGGKREK